MYMCVCVKQPFENPLEIRDRIGEACKIEPTVCNVLNKSGVCDKSYLYYVYFIKPLNNERI